MSDGNRSSVSLEVPTEGQRRDLVRKFVHDLESYSIHDEESGTLRPVLCAICDSMAQCPQWGSLVYVHELRKLLVKCQMEASVVSDLYPEALLRQYRVRHKDLEEFVLSPETYVSADDKVLVCKSCYGELQVNATKQKRERHPPKESIINGYVIGDAPEPLSVLNDVELALISRVQIYCHTWVFFAGCHQQIKGWHTFFKNRPEENVANLSLLSDDDVQGTVLVALCGPFTPTQKAMTLKKTVVDPKKVIAGWRWLKANNFRFRDHDIPHIDDIPVPEIIEEDV